jgi:hypothetical protein
MLSQGEPRQCDQLADGRLCLESDEVAGVHFWLMKSPVVERQPTGNGDCNISCAIQQTLAALATGLAIAEATSTTTGYPFLSVD